MLLSAIKANPANPRLIKDDRFAKLVQSLKDFPAMMELRPIITDAEGVVLGGNMRLSALKELGYTEIPNSWVKPATSLTEAQKKRRNLSKNRR